MNILFKNVACTVRTCLFSSIKRNSTCTIRNYASSLQKGLLFGPMQNCVNNVLNGMQQIAEKTTLSYMHRRGKPVYRKHPKKNPLGFGVPYAKGIVLQTLIKKPKKPNSANRKCVRVRLSNKKEMVAYVPGEGHNLQEHSVVLVRPGRLRDTPNVKIKCVRGVYDLPHVSKKTR